MLKNLTDGQSSWELLKSSPLPIIIYGTGNGADRVFAECDRLGITISGVCASDGFVRKRSFHGFEVKSVSDFEAEYEDFIIALSFASPLDEVIDNIKALSLRHTVIMPSVPVYGDSIFNKDFFQAHYGEIEKAYSLLSDEKSKKVFENIIRFQITGNLNYCFECESTRDEAYSILGLDNDEGFLDLGAYRGDTVEEFLSYTDGYGKIVAVEPDERTFRKLQAYCDGLRDCIAINSAVWNESTELCFDGNKGRGGSANKKGQCISTVTVDELTEKYGSFTYINIDVEGAEKEMLQGAVKSLQHKPKLCMAAYHRSEDIFSLINQVNEINGNYRIYLRHHKHISFWDTNLYCI